MHVGVRACLRACGHLGHGAASLATSVRRWPWRCVLSSRIECAFNGAHDRCQRAGPARGRTHIARAAKLGREMSDVWRGGAAICAFHRRRRVLRSTARSWRRPAARPEPSRPLKPLFRRGKIYMYKRRTARHKRQATTISIINIEYFSFDVIFFASFLCSDLSRWFRIGVVNFLPGDRPAAAHGGVAPLAAVRGHGRARHDTAVLARLSLDDHGTSLHDSRSPPHVDAFGHTKSAPRALRIGTHIPLLLGLYFTWPWAACADRRAARPRQGGPRAWGRGRGAKRPAPRRRPCRGTRAPRSPSGWRGPSCS